MTTTRKSILRRPVLAMANLLLLGAAVLTSSARADTAGETLLQSVPPHFRVVGRDKTPFHGMVQMVPDDQTGAHWSELMTTEIFFAAKSTSPLAYRGELEREWQHACDQTTLDYAMEGMQNGYPVSLWVQSCRFQSAANKPNIALIKMITGRERAYVVQVNFRYVPDKDKIKQWTDYLDKVYVCDPRWKGHECPAPTQP